MAGKINPPAPRPCESCPYRKDVPQGVWAPDEYMKLLDYDNPTAYQPTGIFLCHQVAVEDPRARICSGWAGCHDTDSLLAMRLAVISREITYDVFEAVARYESPVPLFSSGAEAAFHGLIGVNDPDDEAKKVVGKIMKIRGDIRPGVVRPDTSQE